MENEQIDEFLKQVDAKFAGQTPNGPDDPRRLTVGLSQWDELIEFSDRFSGADDDLIGLVREYLSRFVKKYRRICSRLFAG